MPEMQSLDQAIPQSARIVADTRTTMTQSINVLRGQVESIGASWQGAAKTAFDQLMMQWNEDTSKVVAVLDRFHSDLLGTDKDYTAQDDSGRSRMASVQSRLAR